MSGSAPAYELFDIVSEEPRVRTSRRKAARLAGDVGPVFARQLDERQLRTFEVTVRHAKTIEVQRLRDLFAQTRFGALPMRFVPTGEAELLVAFSEPRLVWQQLNSSIASFVVRLEEVLGG
jgi:hypothetical protein